MQLTHQIFCQKLCGVGVGERSATLIALLWTLSFSFASSAMASVLGVIFIGFLAASLKVPPIFFSKLTSQIAGMMTVAFINLTVANLKIGTVMTFTIIIARGVLQFFWGALQLGQCITVTPYEVIADFTFSIGIILGILRHHPFLGQSSPRDGLIKMSRGMPELLTDIQPTGNLLPELKYAIAQFMLAANKYISD